MKKIILIPCLLFACILTAQQNYSIDKGGSGLYRTGPDKLDKGWFFGVGVTYMMPYNRVTDQSEFTDSLTGITYSEHYAAQPKTTFSKSFSTQLGPFLEIGKFRMNGKRVINYLDYFVQMVQRGRKL